MWGGILCQMPLMLFYHWALEITKSVETSSSGGVNVRGAVGREVQKLGKW